MRAKEPGQSLLLMLDVADGSNSHQSRYAVIGAVAAAVHGSVRARLDADALVAVPIPAAQRPCGEFEVSGLKAQVRMGDREDPVAALLAASDSFEKRVDPLMGLRGVDSGVYTRASPQVLGREDFIAMKVFAGGPQDTSGALSAIATNPELLDLELLRRFALQFGRDTALTLETLLP